MAADRASSECSITIVPLTKKVGVPVTPALSAPSIWASRAARMVGPFRQASICSRVLPLAAMPAANQGWAPVV